MIYEPLLVSSRQVSAAAAAAVPEARRKRAHHTLNEKVDLYTLAAVLVTLLGAPPAWRAGYYSDAKS